MSHSIPLYSFKLTTVKDTAAAQISSAFLSKWTTFSSLKEGPYKPFYKVMDIIISDWGMFFDAAAPCFGKPNLGLRTFQVENLLK